MIKHLNILVTHFIIIIHHQIELLVHHPKNANAGIKHHLVILPKFQYFVSFFIHSNVAVSILFWASGCSSNHISDCNSIRSFSHLFLFCSSFNLSWCCFFLNESTFSGKYLICSLIEHNFCCCLWNNIINILFHLNIPYDCSLHYH